MYVKCKWYSVVTQSRIWYNLIKAARKTDADAGLARSYADIFTNRLRFVSAAPMSMERFFAQDVQKRSGMRMGGALRERAWREAMRALIKKQRGKRTQMPGLPGHMRTFSQTACGLLAPHP